MRTLLHLLLKPCLWLVMNVSITDNLIDMLILQCQVWFRIIEDSCNMLSCWMYVIVLCLFTRSILHWASIWIIFGHRLGKFILNKHIAKIKVYFSHRGDKCDEITRCQFLKITETACLSGWELEADESRYGVYVTRHWNLMNSYWMFWIGCLRGARSVSSFCDFRKITFRDLTAFSPFWHEKILCFSDILIKEY